MKGKEKDGRVELGSFRENLPDFLPWIWENMSTEHKLAKVQQTTTTKKIHEATQRVWEAWGSHTHTQISFVHLL